MASETQDFRRLELERVYQSRKKHSPQLSISDDSHHVTEAIGSWYEDTATTPTSPSAAGRLGVGGGGMGMTNGDGAHHRPLSYINAPSERESFEARRQRRHGTLMDNNNNTSRRTSPPPPSRAPLARAQSNEKVRSPTDPSATGLPKTLHRMASHGSENMSSQNSPTSPPPLSRQSSSDTAVQHFPLNDIDYESSPAAVAQELSNLQAIRRMSMNVDTADPDLPSFGGSISPVAPKQSDDDDEDDPSKLFWVPARLHPELAPKEFKTFIEDRVDKIRRRSGGEDSLSADGMSRSGSVSSLQRKKSMLSHQIDTKGNYEDGAERLERKRSKGMTVEGQTTVSNLSDLENLVKDPAQLMRRMSLDTQRRSQDSGHEASSSDDVPILPPIGTLKRSTRTTYRRGSLKKGERVPFSKRAAHRQAEPGSSDDTPPSPAVPSKDEPVLGLQRVQTEPIPPAKESRETYPRSAPDRRNFTSQSEEDLPREQRSRESAPPPRREDYREERPISQPPSSQQPRQFQSRIASPGRTTAQLPGYNNTNPLPQIVETLPDGTKVPSNNLIQNQNHPERKSSHELPRQFQRGGAHMRPVPGREKAQSSTLDDISSHPSPLPGSGNTRTDALTMVPTYDEKKADKKDGSRKSSWNWLFDRDDKKSKEDADNSSSKSRGSKISKNLADKARLDVLQNSIDGNVSGRGRESIVLNRDDIKLDEERKKESKKYSDPVKEKSKEPGLLSAIFGGKKKSSDGEVKEKRRKTREHSPEPAARILKPDIDYNWTRFSILEERAIYRMAHIKLANPRRALYSQVLLSNFMYSYLAKVQMMHPQMQIPASQRAAQRGQQEEQQKKQQQQQQQQQESHPPEYNQYQRWQEVSNIRVNDEIHD